MRTGARPDRQHGRRRCLRGTTPGEPGPHPGRARVVGRKIGLTSEAVQRQLGVDIPDFGVLFDDMAYADGAAVPMSRLLQPKVEAELAFVLATDLDGDLSPATIRAAVDHAVVALEIVDSRIAGWDISYADTVADNASSGLFVLGSTRLDLADFEPRDTTMSMTLNNEVVSTGSGTACLGDPLNALLWLARAGPGVRRTAPRRAGDPVGRARPDGTRARRRPRDHHLDHSRAGARHRRGSFRGDH
ncbi:2-keto-4-pentenoate hydratase [Nocardioides sp. B-3]|uniref:2-keto-4-pentenoate hydratase n=1 Tax=Nocardioides sp. B-3 TaxID=2895565 RepID=UPI002342F663|nr:fumarylacetoacetate hydrolase family protein [Nocardioides sp. B-3]